MLYLSYTGMRWMRPRCPIVGEMAIVGNKPRGATARCDEPTKVLSVSAEHFATFVEVVPMFKEIFEVSQKGYNAYNSMMREKADLTQTLADTMKSIAEGGFSTKPSTTPLTIAEGKWEKLVIKLLAVAKGEPDLAEEAAEDKAALTAAGTNTSQLDVIGDR